MAIFNANILMRELRKAAGLSQAQAAEGVCARQTISAIERGERKPDWYTFSNILRKYNVDPSRYYSDIASEDEMYIYNQMNVCNQLADSFDKEGFKREIDKMELDDRFKTGLGYQVLVGFKSVLYAYGPYENVDLAMQACLEYLKFSRPQFNIDKISSYFLTESELRAVGRLATVYLSVGVNKANEIIDMDALNMSLKLRYMVLENIEKNYSINMADSLRYIYIYTISNQSAILVSTLKQPEEAIVIIDKALNLLKGLNANVWLYFRILRNKVRALMLMGQREEARAAFKRCLHFAYATDEDAYTDMKVKALKLLWTETLNGESFEFDRIWADNA